MTQAPSAGNEYLLLSMMRVKAHSCILKFKKKKKKILPRTFYFDTVRLLNNRNKEKRDRVCRKVSQNPFEHFPGVLHTIRDC